MFRPYEHNPKFANIFRYKNRVSFTNHWFTQNILYCTVLYYTYNTTIVVMLLYYLYYIPLLSYYYQVGGLSAHSPLVLAITDLARHIRALGESLGYKHPDIVTEVTMFGLSPVLDFLTSTTDCFFRHPNYLTPLTGSGSWMRSISLQGYYVQAVKAGRTMYDGAANASLSLDNLLHFTPGNVAYVDGSLGDLARTKMLSIFKSAQTRGL